MTIHFHRISERDGQTDGRTELLYQCADAQTRLVWLPDGKKTLMICLAVSTEYRCVTDGRTDILPLHNPRYAYASRDN